MSTRPEFVQYLLDQLEGLGELRARKMFGDYLIYLNDRPALLVCDGPLRPQRAVSWRISPAKAS